MRSVLVALSLLVLGAAAPIASASHDCERYSASALGFDVFTCLDERGLPHEVFVRDDSLGGAWVTYPFFSEPHEWNGGNFQYADVLVYTYSGTPTGRTWFHPFLWCTDTDGDGFCDDTWIGASSYARGFFNQAHVDRQPHSGGWRVCLLLSTGWGCHALPVDLGPGFPVLPILP